MTRPIKISEVDVDRMYNYSLYCLIAGFFGVLIGATGLGIFLIVVAFLYSRLGVFAEKTIKKKKAQ